MHLAATQLELLQSVDLCVQAGERVALVGPSGSGKSTLLGLLAGLDSPTAGRIWVFGDEMTALDEEGRANVRRERVGFVFQNFQLLPSLSALENVMLPLELSASPSRGKARREAAQAVLSRVGLADRAQHYPRQLSGGEQQRVAIARAFASRPQILFADEPTGNLDQDTGQRVADLLFELNRQAGTTLVLVTHDDALAQRCDRSFRMHQGRLSPRATTGRKLEV